MIPGTVSGTLDLRFLVMIEDYRLGRIIEIPAIGTRYLIERLALDQRRRRTTLHVRVPTSAEIASSAEPPIAIDLASICGADLK